jgi:hypothetical protein
MKHTELSNNAADIALARSRSDAHPSRSDRMNTCVPPKGLVIKETIDGREVTRTVYIKKYAAKDAWIMPRKNKGGMCGGPTGGNTLGIVPQAFMR